MQKREAKMALKTWVKPTIRRIGSGSAEFSGSGSADGSGIYS